MRVAYEAGLIIEIQTISDFSSKILSNRNICVNIQGVPAETTTCTYRNKEMRHISESISIAIFIFSVIAEVVANVFTKWSIVYVDYK